MLKMGHEPTDGRKRSHENALGCARRAGAKVTARFDHWKLSIDDRAALPDVSQDAVIRYREGVVAGSSRDRFERVVHLLAIHKHLRVLFPHNQDLVYCWMTTGNKAFHGQKPVEAVRDRGFSGLLMVRAYLESARGQ